MSCDAAGTAERMRAAGYEDWEIREEVESHERATRLVAEHTAAMREGRRIEVWRDLQDEEPETRARLPDRTASRNRKAEDGRKPREREEK